MFFETGRLYVRKLNLDDFISFHEMQSNERVMKYIIDRPKTKEENIKELNKTIKSYEGLSSDFLVMAVVRKIDNQFIGICAIVLNEDGEHEIGFRFLERYWGMGFGKEIIKGLIEYSFLDIGLDLVAAYVNKDNITSVKILDSSKMKFIKEYEDKDLGGLVRYYRLEKGCYDKVKA